MGIEEMENELPKMKIPKETVAILLSFMLFLRVYYFFFVLLSLVFVVIIFLIL